MPNWPRPMNVSPATCHRRTQRLFDEGYIRSVRAEIAPDKVDRGALVIVGVVLDRSTPESFAAFEAAIAETGRRPRLPPGCRRLRLFPQDPGAGHGRLQSTARRATDCLAGRASDAHLFRHERSRRQPAARLLAVSESTVLGRCPAWLPAHPSHAQAGGPGDACVTHKCGQPSLQPIIADDENVLRDLHFQAVSRILGWDPSSAARFPSSSNKHLRKSNRLAKGCPTRPGTMSPRTPTDRPCRLRPAISATLLSATWLSTTFPQFAVSGR